LVYRGISDYKKSAGRFLHLLSLRSGLRGLPLFANARSVMPIRNRLFSFLAAFLALFSLAAVPNGMMPAWGAGGFSMTLCSPAQTAQTAHVTVMPGDANYHTLRQIERAQRAANGEMPADGHDRETANESCAFAGFSSAAAILPDITGNALAILTNSAEPQHYVSLAVLHRRYAPPATGPPAYL